MKTNKLQKKLEKIYKSRSKVKAPPTKIHKNKSKNLENQDFDLDTVTSTF